MQRLIRRDTRFQTCAAEKALPSADRLAWNESNAQETHAKSLAKRVFFLLQGLQGASMRAL
jgi:hypothetical protein